MDCWSGWRGLTGSEEGIFCTLRTVENIGVINFFIMGVGAKIIAVDNNVWLEFELALCHNFSQKIQLGYIFLLPSPPPQQLSHKLSLGKKLIILIPHGIFNLENIKLF